MALDMDEPTPTARASASSCPSGTRRCNILPLLEEIERACAPLEPFEVVYVDDGSTGRDAGGAR